MVVLAAALAGMLLGAAAAVPTSEAAPRGETHRSTFSMSRRLQTEGNAETKENGYWGDRAAKGGEAAPGDNWGAADATPDSADLGDETPDPADLGPPMLDLLWTVNTLAREVTKWIVATIFEITLDPKSIIIHNHPRMRVS